MKAETAAEIQRLKEDSSSWEGKWEERSKKFEAAAEEAQRRESETQVLAAQKEKAIRELQDAIKVWHRNCTSMS